MITQIIDLLQTDDFYGISERVDRAKGIYAYPNTWKEGFTKIKRILLRWQRK